MVFVLCVGLITRLQNVQIEVVLLQGSELQHFGAQLALEVIQAPSTN
jgi:hypothetical protein